MTSPRTPLRSSSTPTAEPVTHRLARGEGVARVQFWLRSAAPGDVLLYHRGNLGAARGQSPVLADVAEQLARAARRGEVALAQRRIERGGPTLYCATRLTRPVPSAPAPRRGR